MKKLLALIFTAMLALSLGVVAFADEPVAAVEGGEEYATLQEAINNAGKGGTVILLQDIENSDSVTIEEDLMLRLEGHALIFADGKTLTIEDPKGIVIAGPGLIKSKNGTAVTVTGSAAKVPNPDFNDQQPEGPGNGPAFFPAFHIVGDVRIEGQVALHLTNTNTSETDIGNNDGEIVVEGSGLNGLGENGIALKVSGDGGEIRLEGANLNAGSHGVFCKGDSWINISGAAVTGNKTAIEMRAGMVQVFEGPATITANADNYSSTANTGGPTTVGAAIAIVRGDKYRPVGANIFGGKILGYVAIAQSDPDEIGTGYKDDPDANAVTIDIDGNALISVINGGREIVKSAQLENFIIQGFFRSYPDGEYVAPDDAYIAENSRKEDMGDRCLVTNHIHTFYTKSMMVDEHGGHYICKAGPPGSCPASSYANIPGSGYHEHNFSGENRLCIHCEIYPVWVYGNLVNTENCGDILGDGTARYDAENGILYLENANMYTETDVYGSYYGIYANEPLTVVYSGENSVFDTHIVIWAEDDLILKGADEEAVLAVGSDFGGIAAERKLTLDNGYLDIRAVNYGIIANSQTKSNSVGFAMKNNARYFARIERLDTESDNSALVYLGESDMLGYKVLGSTDTLGNGIMPEEEAHFYSEVDGETGIKTSLYIMDPENSKSYVKTILIEADLDYEPEHEHEWSEAWSSNANGHWHNCTDDCPITDNAQKDGYGEHIYSDSSDKSCNTCGYEREVSAPAPSAPSSCDHSFDKDGKCTKCGIAVIDHSGKKPAEEANPNTGAESAVSVMAAVAVLALAGAVISKK